VLIKDRWSSQLMPIWADQDWLVKQLGRIVPKKRLRVIPVSGSDEFDNAARVASASVHAPVLALSDLGQQFGATGRASWQAFGERLLRAGHTTHVLLQGCPQSRAALPPAWSAVPWESKRPHDPASAERLLALLSLASHMELGLLRTLRQSGVVGPTSVETELAAWNSPHVEIQHEMGIALSPSALVHLRAMREREPAEARKLAQDLVRQWHEHLPRMVHAKEVLTEAVVTRDPTLLASPEYANTLNFVRRLAATAVEADPNSEFHAALWHSNQRFLEWLPHTVDDDPKAGQAIRRLRAWASGKHSAGLSKQPLRWLTVFLRGDQVSWVAVKHAWQLPVPKGLATPLVAMLARRPSLRVQIGSEIRHIEESASIVGLDLRAEMTLRTDAMEVHLHAPPRPSWAVSWGRDRFGLFADDRIAGVVQRFRYIPPGRFWMGSPPDEPGRLDAEGPQHLVTLSRGFWLANTPCTQELWQAVMGQNPSQFKSPQRPVEQVSHEDVGALLAKLNRRGTTDPYRLPTEAEWEYACRAGTTTATYAGPMEIRGECDAPVLDAIAWYGGNSGHELDLPAKQAVDSSDWPNKQYPHTRAATRVVAQKLPNGWGLYDMLGSVWEWCADGFRDYGDPAQRDPTDAFDSDNAVFRGGSWVDDALFARAAFRNHGHRGRRSGNLGFRLARG
jgi:formylglycine-generating enzyme required for sulfatase activity